MALHTNPMFASNGSPDIANPLWSIATTDSLNNRGFCAEELVLFGIAPKTSQPDSSCNPTTLRRRHPQSGPWSRSAGRGAKLVRLASLKHHQTARQSAARFAPMRRQNSRAARFAPDDASETHPPPPSPIGVHQMLSPQIQL